MTKIEKAFNYMVVMKKVTSLQIYIFVGTTAPGSMMADLRKRGCIIPRAKYLYTSKNDGRVFEYTLVSHPKVLGKLKGV